MEIAEAGGLHRVRPAGRRALRPDRDRRPARLPLGAAREHRASGEGYVDGLWDTDDLVALCRIACRSLPPLDRLRARGPAAAAARCSRAGAGPPQHPERAPAATSPPTTTSATRCSKPSSTRGWSTRAPSSRTSGRRSRRRSWRSSSASAPRSTSARTTTCSRSAPAGAGSPIHAAATRGCRVTTTTISREQHAYATERVREAGLDDRVDGPARRLPRPHRHLRQAGLDRDDRGGRVAVLPDVLRSAARR